MLLVNIDNIFFILNTFRYVITTDLFTEKLTKFIDEKIEIVQRLTSLQFL